MWQTLRNLLVSKFRKQNRTARITPSRLGPGSLHQDPSERGMWTEKAGQKGKQRGQGARSGTSLPTSPRGTKSQHEQNPPAGRGRLPAGLTARLPHSPRRASASGRPCPALPCPAPPARGDPAALLQAPERKMRPAAAGGLRDWLRYTPWLLQELVLICQSESESAEYLRNFVGEMPTCGFACGRRTLFHQSRNTPLLGL